MMKNIRKISILFCFTLFFTGCFEAANNTRLPGTSSEIVGPGTGGGSNSAINIALNNAETVEEAVVEIRHLIEPKIDENGDGGTYLKKLTIPKNYDGLLYVAGLNISTLVNDSIKLRFRFGVDNAPIDVEATVSTAPGLTPQTNVQVLVLDMSPRQFQNVRLLYDLYDYNTYDFAGDGSEQYNEPVQLNRDKNLFCRGLNLEDDPTFQGNVTSGCNTPGAVCKYAFAKVVDQGLVRNNGGVLTPITPSEANVQSGNDSYYEDTDGLKLSRCIPNKNNLTFKYDDSLTFSAGLLSAVINGLVYEYKGPYRKVNDTLWQIQSAAEVGQYGLFGEIDGGNYYESKLFPLAAKRSLPKDVEYLGSATPDGFKGLTFQAANGDTQWMDGCNERATTRDYLGEHVGSCNVTSKVEIIRTRDNGTEEIISSQDVKLQLVKDSVINSSGDDVVLSSFQSCSSSSQCGSDSCCIGNRCWDKDVVSQCVEDQPSYGLLNPGANCSSDYECSSLCCSQTTGKCAVHNTDQSPPTFCSKGVGQRCIAKEWCAQVPVTQCYIIKTGLDNQGGDTCALRCYTFERHGDCEDGICKPPVQPTLPTFDPNDPNRCADACDAPDFSNGYFDFQCGDGN
jgi:hypothetical protein